MTGPLLPMREDEPRLSIRWWIVLPCFLLDPISIGAVLVLVLVVKWQERRRAPRGSRRGR